MPASMPVDTAMTAVARTAGLAESPAIWVSSVRGENPGARWRPTCFATMYLSKNAYEVSCRVRVGVDHPALGPAR